MTADSTSNPAGIHFYDPEYWVISGKKYHRSHLIIARGATTCHDILKPTYVFTVKRATHTTDLRTRVRGGTYRE